jgi:hypothetical protein
VTGDFQTSAEAGPQIVIATRRRNNDIRLEALLAHDYSIRASCPDGGEAADPRLRHLSARDEAFVRCRSSFITRFLA